MESFWQLALIHLMYSGFRSSLPWSNLSQFAILGNLSKFWWFCCDEKGLLCWPGLFAFFASTGDEQSRFYLQGHSVCFWEFVEVNKKRYLVLLDFCFCLCFTLFCLNLFKKEERVCLYLYTMSGITVKNNDSFGQ